MGGQDLAHPSTEEGGRSILELKAEDANKYQDIWFTRTVVNK